MSLHTSSRIDKQETSPSEGSQFPERNGVLETEKWVSGHYVVLLSDWSDTNPDTLYGNLKKQGDYYNFHKRTAGTFINDAKSKGLRSTVQNRLTLERTNISDYGRVARDPAIEIAICLVKFYNPSCRYKSLFDESLADLLPSEQG